MSNYAEDTYVMPDILVHPAALETPDVRGGDVLLLIEVADTSVSFLGPGPLLSKTAATDCETGDAQDDDQDARVPPPTGSAKHPVRRCLRLAHG